MSRQWWWWWRWTTMITMMMRIPRGGSSKLPQLIHRIKAQANSLMVFGLRKNESLTHAPTGLPCSIMCGCVSLWLSKKNYYQRLNKEERKITAMEKVGNKGSKSFLFKRPDFLLGSDTPACLLTYLLCGLLISGRSWGWIVGALFSCCLHRLPLFHGQLGVSMNSSWFSKNMCAVFWRGRPWLQIWLNRTLIVWWTHKYLRLLVRSLLRHNQFTCILYFVLNKSDSICRKFNLKSHTKQNMEGFFILPHNWAPHKSKIACYSFEEKGFIKRTHEFHCTRGGPTKNPW